MYVEPSSDDLCRISRFVLCDPDVFNSVDGNRMTFNALDTAYDVSLLRLVYLTLLKTHGTARSHAQT